MISYGTIFVFLLLGTVTYQKDLTTRKGSKGSDVVEATLDRIKSKCIFQDDHLFMRRLAYVATKDGTDSSYVIGTGGIWQVPRSDFSRVIFEEKRIKDSFGIEWSTVTYDKLDIPLYSALATHLLIELISDNIKANKTKQAKYWAKHWSNGAEKKYIDNADSIPMPACSKEVDLVFVMDESGSVGYINYRNMKYFLSNITDKLTIGLDAFHVGAVKFNWHAQKIFSLNEYDTKSKIKEALIRDRYGRGLTSISAGIKKAEEVFKDSTRKEATRVLLLLTDGRSHDIEETKKAANVARNESNIVIYALGIGNIDDLELSAAANQPTCTHKFVIENFEEIDSLLYQIIKHTCGVSKPVNLAKESKIDIIVPMKKDDVVNDTLEVTPGNDATTTLQVMAACATVDLYASSETTNPNEAFYNTTEKATEALPAVLEVGNNGAKVYVTYKGSVLHLDRCKAQGGSFNITIQEGAPTVSKIISLVYVPTAEMEVKLTVDSIEKTFEVMPGNDTKTTIQVTAVCAVVDVYASIDTTRPDEHSYNTKGKASEGLPAVLEVDNNGMKFYVTYKGSKLNLDRCKVHGGGFNITVTKGAPKGVEIVCRENGHERACQTEDLAQVCHGAGGIGSITYDMGSGSQSGNHDVSNTQGSDMNGNANGGQNSYGSSGGGNDVSSSNCRQLEPDVPNPCGSVDSTYYYAYKKDDGYYVQCDEWGNACVKQCSPGTKWNNKTLTCEKPETTDNEKKEGSIIASPNASKRALGGTFTGTASSTTAECQVGQANECTGDQTKYKVCVHNKWQELACPAGLECKIATATCDYPSTRRGFDVKSLIKALREYEDEKYEEEDPYDDE